MKNRQPIKSYRHAIALVLIFSIPLLTKGQPAGGPARYNQVGYAVAGPKTAVVDEHITAFKVLDSVGTEVTNGASMDALYWDQSGERVRKIDFSSIRKPGRYTLCFTGSDEKCSVTIASHPYDRLMQAALKAFYFNRSGTTIEPSYGGKWARKSGHPDTVVFIHPSAAGPKQEAGSVISSPGGWYDAGDYNKYIVNSSISVYTMLQAYEMAPEKWSTLEAGIPESNDSIPDILQEALFNLRWMTTMQDTSDGGVYHKLTNKEFDGIVMPCDATNHRFVVSKTTAASLDFAAVAAHTSLLLAKTGLHTGMNARQLLHQAEKAWQWAVANPAVVYVQPADIKTGQYDDNTLTDEFFWAACELFLATAKPEYLDAIVNYYQKPTTPEWAIVNGLGFMSLIQHRENLPESLNTKKIIGDFIALADSLVQISETAPYGISLQKFFWGSNSYAANQGVVKLVAYSIHGDSTYLRSACSDLDYLLGRNPTGYCYVTGFGSKPAMNIHHRPSQADGIAEPVPGFLVGGPNTVVMNDCSDVIRSVFPAASYTDTDCSYSTNEVAINWNAPLLLLAAGCNLIF